MSEPVVNRFETWEHGTLARFSQECLTEVERQRVEIETLRQDLRNALTAYRKEVLDHART